MGIMEQELQKKLEQILEPSLVLDTVEYTTKLQPGDNYFSESFCVKVIGHTSSDQKPYEKHLFIKRIPKVSPFFNLLFYDNAFNNEKLFYTKFIKDQTHIPTVPKCLGAEPDIIVLEDLFKNNFHSPDRKSLLSLTHMELVIEELARLHYCSFYLKKTNGSLYQEILSELKPCYLDETMEMFFEGSIKASLIVLNEEVNKYNTSIQVIDSHYGKVMQLIKSVMGNMNTNFYVLVHGDCWLKNYMFQYENNTPRKVCLVDFQIINERHLIFDLVNAIWPNTEAITKYESLLIHYHTTLSKLLREINIEPPKISDLISNYKSCLPVGLLMAITRISALCLDAAAFEDSNNTTELNFDAKNISEKVINPLYKERIKEVADCYQQLCTESE